jgi:hypothetical protein
MISQFEIAFEGLQVGESFCWYKSGAIRSDEVNILAG